MEILKENVIPFSKELIEFCESILYSNLKPIQLILVLKSKNAVPPESEGRVEGR